MMYLLRHSRTLILPWLLLISVMAGARPAAASLEVSGTTYSSPNFGYSITWPSTWFLIEERSDQGFDFLTISDGFAIVVFAGGPALGTPAVELASVLLTCGSEGTSNCAPVFDETGAPIRGSDENSAFATITFDQDTGDGFSFSFVSLTEVRTLEPGISLLTMATVNENAYEGFLPMWDTLLGGITTLGGPADPLPATDPAPDPVQDPEPAARTDPVQVSAFGGEAAPVVVSNQWRFAIASTIIGIEIASLELEEASAGEWLVIIADVTNWSEIDATFSLLDPLVQTVEMTEPFDLERSKTRLIARLLGLSNQGNDSADIAAGSTSRIVLVYKIPAAGTDTLLLLADQVLPLADTFDLAFDPASLPVVSSPPTLELEEGIISGFNGGSSINVRVAGAETEIALIGASVPTTGSCYSLQALSELLQYTGATVLLESDPAVTSAAARYVWIVYSDGSKRLMNQLLLESGAVSYTSTPETARFAAWLQGTESAAQQSGTGLWSTCAV